MVIVMANSKGGVGKTTGAIGLATAAAREGLPVTVWDADPQSSASEWAELASEEGSPLPFEVRPANITVVRRLANNPGIQVVDTPPSGKVVDEAMRHADITIVPCGPKPIESARTAETIDALEKAGLPYAVLVCRRPGQRRLATERLRGRLEERDASYLDTEIPEREALSNTFGHAFGDNLFGYDDAWSEIEEAVSDGDQEAR